MRIAWVFPGQGSQTVGMGQALAERFPIVRQTFDEADRVLGFQISQLCFSGPAEELRQTAVTQPAMLIAGVACARLLQEAGFAPDLVAGHSLGEYTALVAAGALRFGDAVQVVRRRGELMEAAVPDGSGGMAAVLGLDGEAVKAVCSQAAARGVVAPANWNAPGQVVIAGERAALDYAAELAKEAGAKRVVPLDVSGPFHTPLVAEAGVALGTVLQQVEVRPPKVPLVANVSAIPQSSPEVIRRGLVEQVSTPVRWVECVERMVADGVDTFIEVGPGKVLSGLIRRIAKGVRTLNVDSPSSWDALLASLKGDGVG